jgi:hypothetical protein
VAEMVPLRIDLRSCPGIQEGLRLARVKGTMAKYPKADRVLVENMGMKMLPERLGASLWEIFIQRYRTRSSMKRFNWPIEKWGRLICDGNPGSFSRDLITLSGWRSKLTSRRESGRGKIRLASPRT